MDILETYDNYIRDKAKQDNGWLRASSAGRCFKLQQYNLSDKTPEPFTDRTLRLFRLGDLVHQDIQASIDLVQSMKSSIAQSHVSIEKEITISEFGVKGHIDMVVFCKEVTEIYDIKTCSSYKWSKTFGHKKNRDENSDVNYKLQLGTYGLGLTASLMSKPIELYLLWYNKNNSHVKKVSVSNEWMTKAGNYWQALQETLKDDLEKGDLNCPVSDWECKYCQYSKYCEGE